MSLLTSKYLKLLKNNKKRWAARSLGKKGMDIAYFVAQD
jgi:hypothetical protein